MKKVRLVKLTYWSEGRPMLDSVKNLGKVLDVQGTVMRPEGLQIQVSLPDGKTFCLKESEVEIVE